MEGKKLDLPIFRGPNPDGWIIQKGSSSFEFLWADTGRASGSYDGVVR